jgi:hypothetical protein
VNGTNPSGHYRFDLAAPFDREQLQVLVALGRQESGENWRNERLNAQRFSFPADGEWQVRAPAAPRLRCAALRCAALFAAPRCAAPRCAALRCADAALR